MKIRYYLRGLGLGILITSIFFLVGGSSSKTISDEQIKARAKELGMIESTVLAEISTEEASKEEMTEAESVEENSTEAVMETETETETETEAAVSETVDEVQETEESSVEEVSSEAEEESKPEEAAVEESSAVKEPISTALSSEAVSIVVHSGEGSDDVSRRLADMGLVADAHEYDKYLMANGYDKKIRTGEHIIPAGATWEEMAKILCNRN